ncbi:Facilitated trehalose transporter Tret1, partial [Pseudolycoriella hygida]
AAVTCVPSGYLIYWIGRKWSLLLLTIPALVGWALILFATNFLMMVFGRISLGITVGGTFVIAPVYIGEISQSEIRGTLGTMFQLLVTIGILFAYTIGAWVNVFLLTLICLILPIIFAVIFVWMPESPTY